MDLDHDACYRAISTRDPRFDGRLFTGVKTTGIYCRPICPARIPLRRNVRFYPTAAAAQSAGFRPCLRCRPETAPDVAAWRGTSNTVSRALSLIEAGALDEGDVNALALRLGVGERHLRRLFDQHVGAAPIAVAQTRRVLLAKQLVHETCLPMTQVAMAAGFGSIRRFNEAFRDLFGRSLSSLRRTAADDVSAATAGGVTVLLRYQPPYDWSAMLAFLQARAIPGLETIRGARYSRSIDIAGKHGIVSVEPAAGAALRATIQVPDLTVLPLVIARLRRLFDLAADPQSIGEHLAEDALLAPLIASRPGLRVPGAWDGFELAVRAMLGQQVSVRAGIGLVTWVVQQYGAANQALSPFHPELTKVFPTASRLAAADLSALGMPQARARALSLLAAEVVADPQIFGARRTLEEAVLQLRGLAGVGEWTAQYIAMRELREPDAFPAADVALLRAMTDAAGKRPTPRALLQRAECWRPWRAYAAQHLWTGVSSES